MINLFASYCMGCLLWILLLLLFCVWEAGRRGNYKLTATYINFSVYSFHQDGNFFQDSSVSCFFSDIEYDLLHHLLSITVTAVKKIKIINILIIMLINSCLLQCGQENHEDLKYLRNFSCVMTNITTKIRTCELEPWSQRFFLQFFFRKERERRKAARGERKPQKPLGTV